MLAQQARMFEQARMAQAKICSRCGRAATAVDAIYCARCGEPLDDYLDEISDRSRLIALLLCIFLGYLGVHRFYAGRFITGTIWLLTGGLAGIGWFIDCVLIVTGHFRDDLRLPLVIWEP